MDQLADWSTSPRIKDFPDSRFKWVRPVQGCSVFAARLTQGVLVTVRLSRAVGSAISEVGDCSAGVTQIGTAGSGLNYLEHIKHLSGAYSKRRAEK